MRSKQTKLFSMVAGLAFLSLATSCAELKNAPKGKSKLSFMTIQGEDCGGTLELGGSTKNYLRFDVFYNGLEGNVVGVGKAYFAEEDPGIDAYKIVGFAPLANKEEYLSLKGFAGKLMDVGKTVDISLEKVMLPSTKGVFDQKMNAHALRMGALKAQGKDDDIVQEEATSKRDHPIIQLVKDPHNVYLANYGQPKVLGALSADEFSATNALGRVGSFNAAIYSVKSKGIATTLLPSSPEPPQATWEPQVKAMGGDQENQTKGGMPQTAPGEPLKITIAGDLEQPDGVDSNLIVEIADEAKSSMAVCVMKDQPGKKSWEAVIPTKWTGSNGGEQDLKEGSYVLRVIRSYRQGNSDTAIETGTGSIVRMTIKKPKK